MSNFKLLKKQLGLSAAVLFLTMASPGAIAAGTASGTNVENFATINYDVASIAQPALNSDTVDFMVDTQIDLTVSTVDLAAVASTPGSDDNVMTFTVTNTGNASQDFSLSAVTLVGGTAAFGGTDNINADTVNIFVETAGGAGYQVVSDTDLHINALAADDSITVYIVSDFALGYADGDIASYYLLAEARVDDAAGTLGDALSETVGPDTAGSVDIVFIDGDGDGPGISDVDRDAQHSSQDDYTIVTAALTISKASSVVSDPVNGTLDPKRIPGAIIQYEITISNGAGAAIATSIAITDSLNTEITEGDIAFNTQFGATAGNGFSIAHPGFS
ncbi:hypothetical protein MNBD_GAMMA17-1736, partial [hydrothermal vent metagenome]